MEAVLLVVETLAVVVVEKVAMLVVAVETVTSLVVGVEGVVVAVAWSSDPTAHRDLAQLLELCG